MVKLTGEHRRQQIFDAAESIAKSWGLYSARLNFTAISFRCDCSESTVKYHWKSVQTIREALIKVSFAGDRTLFRQALAESDPIARKLENDSK